MWRPHLIGPVVLAVMVAGLSGCGRGTSAVQAGEVVFTRSATAGSHPSLYAMSPDGSHVRLVVQNAAEAAASPDGSRIAFVRGGAIWVMQRDGSDQRRVTPPGPRDAGDPAWSPDGRTLYFYRSLTAPPPAETWQPAIFSIHIDGTALQRVTRGSCDVAPAPSPNGRLVAFTSMGGMRTLDCIEGAGGFLDAITTSGHRADLPFLLADGWNYEPAWSRDGRHLAYLVIDVNAAEPLHSIWVSTSDGSRPRRMRTPKGSVVSGPAWLPDGQQLAFELNEDIWLVRADGTGLLQLTHTTADETDPAWLPPIQ